MTFLFIVACIAFGISSLLGGLVIVGELTTSKRERDYERALGIKTTYWNKKALTLFLIWVISGTIVFW